MENNETSSSTCLPIPSPSSTLSDQPMIKKCSEQHHLIPSTPLPTNNEATSSSSQPTTPTFKIDTSEFTTATHRILPIETFPKIHYSDENKRHRNALHWGQRKLLLSQI